MNLDTIKESLERIDKELMKAPVNSEELENVRKGLLYRVHFIEQMQCLKFQVA